MVNLPAVADTCPLLLAFLLLLLHFPTVTSDLLYQSCGNSGNYTANSSYQHNLDQLLSFLDSATAASAGFANATYGAAPDRVSGLTLCRGDINASDCQSCVHNATQDVVRLCPYTKSAIIWYDFCRLRFSDQVFFGTIDTNLQVYLASVDPIPDPDRFNDLTRRLLTTLASWAANDSGGRLFATGEVGFTPRFPRIYALVQCTRDLSPGMCYQCLTGIIAEIPTCCAGRQGGRVLGASCNFRFELYPVYEGAAEVVLPSPPLPPADTSNGTTAAGSGGNKKLLIAIVIPIPLAVALVLFLSIGYIYFRKRRKARELLGAAHVQQLFDDGALEEIESFLFDLSTLKIATADFSELNKLGQGGFGAVYKGVLVDGQEIAVKRLLTYSRDGLGELKHELALVAKLKHKNLVRLLGVCTEGQENMLVYEYLPNGSLDTFLFDTIKREELSWVRRYKIIEGIARGLLYLHEESQIKIIHRDLKPSNILLDANLNPKISDFGLARLFGVDQTQGTTSRVIGTFGYMAPEYMLHGRFSSKSDVFSFGVLLLEIVTGRKNNGSFDFAQYTDLLSSTWEHWTNGMVIAIVDPSLDEHYPRSEVLRCIQIGLLCVQEDPTRRPSMSSIVLMLSSNSVTLPAPSQPAFCKGSSRQATKGTNSSDIDNNPTNYIVVMSSNEVSVTELEPR